MRPTAGRTIIATSAALALALTSTTAAADEGRTLDGPDGGALDIAAIAHRHADTDEVTHRVVFRNRFPKRALVRNFELYLEGRRGTTSPFLSPSTLVYGKTLRDDGRIFMRFFYFDVEMVTHRLADVPIDKRPRAAVVRIPTDLVSTTVPFTYRWVARTAWKVPGEREIVDQTDWLWHRVTP